jgi:hypothetical protein
VITERHETLIAFHDHKVVFKNKNKEHYINKSINKHSKGWRVDVEEIRKNIIF